MVLCNSVFASLTLLWYINPIFSWYGQLNKIEYPEINSYIFDQLISNKGAKIIQWGTQ